MKLLIASDSHGDTKTLENLYNFYKNEADLFIHCGDSELTTNVPCIQPFVTVKGNCDTYESGFMNEQFVSKDDLNIFITHGHLFNIKMSPLPIQYRAMERQASLVCFGHTHHATAFMEKGIVYINPGSLLLPRVPQMPTYCLVSWDPATRRLLAEIKQLNHKVIESYSKTFLLE